MKLRIGMLVRKALIDRASLVLLGKPEGIKLCATTHKAQPNGLSGQSADVMALLPGGLFFQIATVDVSGFAEAETADLLLKEPRKYVNHLEVAAIILLQWNVRSAVADPGPSVATCCQLGFDGSIVLLATDGKGRLIDVSALGGSEVMVVGSGSTCVAPNYLISKLKIFAWRSRKWSVKRSPGLTLISWPFQVTSCFN